MDIDGKAVARGCGAEAGDIATSLCRMQTDRIMAALAIPEDGTRRKQPLPARRKQLSLRLLLKKPVPKHRQFSTSGKSRLVRRWRQGRPENRRPCAEAVQAWPGTPAMEMVSHGRCLIYGRGEEALAMGAH